MARSALFDQSVVRRNVGLAPILKEEVARIFDSPQSHWLASRGTRKSILQSPNKSVRSCAQRHWRSNGQKRIDGCPTGPVRRRQLTCNNLGLKSQASKQTS